MSTTMRFCVPLAAALLSMPASPGRARSADCVCDCDGSVSVTIGEVVTAVNIALGLAPASDCPTADSNGDQRVSVDELVAGIQAALGGCPMAPSVTPTPSAIVTPTQTPGDQIPPTNGAELNRWLSDGRYRGWDAESLVHPSGGPHFGRVRTFVNQALFGSLQAGAAVHPAGAAAVKELYGRDGDEVQGWSVSVKVQAESDGGRGWYWYEFYRGTVYGNGVGAPGCIGCHGDNFATLTSKDFVLAPFPLQ